MKEVRVTSLTSFNMCAHAFKNLPYDANIVNTYRGDLLNIAAMSTSPWQSVGMFLKWYTENINPSMKEAEIIAEVMTKAKYYIYRLKTKTYKGETKERPVTVSGIYQEMKMLLMYDKDWLIVGTPDLFYYNDWEFTNPDGSKKGIWIVEDLKFSTKSWYGNDEITKYDCQTIIYPLMVMDRFGVDEVMFRFKLYDKANGKDYYTNQKVITREYAEAFLRDVMNRYIISEEMGMWEANKNPKCFFCSAKKDGSCPLWKALGEKEISIADVQTNEFDIAEFM